MLTPLPLRVFIAAAFLSAVPTQPLSAEPALVASVCDLVGDPTRYAGRAVRLRARYFVDPYHGSFLADERCRGATIAMTWSDTAPHRSIRNLEGAVGTSVAEAAVVLFDVDVVGLFSWDAMAPQPDIRGVIPPRGTIDISRVWAFSRWKL